MFLDAGQVRKLKIAMERASGADLAVTISGGTGGGSTTIISNDFTLLNANGISWGTAGQFVTGSVNTNYQPPGAYLTTAMESNRGTDFVQATAVFAGTNASGTIASNGISVSVADPTTGGGLTNIKFSAGTLSALRSDLTFDNGSGVSFGLETNGVITATVATNYAGTNGAITGGSITVNTSGVSVNLPAYLTTAMASNRGSDFVQATAVFAGTNASGTIASGGISISVADPSTGGGLTNIKVSAGTLSALRSDITFNNGGGVSFGLETNGIITATVSTDYAGTNGAITGGSITVNTSGVSINLPAYLTTAALSQDSSKYAGTNGAITGGSITVNTSGVSVNLPAYLTTAMASNRGSDFVQATAGFFGTNASGTIASNGISVSVADPSTGGGLTNIKVSAGTLSALRSDITFSNLNGVTFGLNTNGVITGSIVPVSTITSVASQGMFWNMDHAVPNTDFYTQDFESGVEPSGWDDFNPGNPPIYDHTPPLDGTFSLALDGPSAGAFYDLVEQQDEVFINFLFQYNQLPVDIVEIMDLYDDVFDEIMQIYLTDTGKLRLTLNANHTTVDTIPINTTVRIWVHYKVHRAGRSLASASFSTDLDSEPISGGAQVSGNDGLYGQRVARLLFGPTQTAGEVYVYDDLHVAKQNYMNFMKVSAGTTVGSLTDVSFANSNGISFGLNASTITATVATNYAGTGTSATNASITLNTNGLAISVAAPSAATISLYPDNIIFPNATALSTYYSGSKSQGGGGNSTLSGYTFSLYFVPIVLPTAVAFSHMRMLMSNATSGGTGSATHVYSAGFYTNNANTLSLVKGYYGGIVLSQNSSTAWTYSVWTASTAGATSDAAGYAGISKASIQSSQGNVNSSLQINGSSKFLRIDSGAMTTLTAGQYWFAYGNAWATSGVNALSLVGVAQAPAVTQRSTGFLDAGVNTSASAPMYGSGWGAIQTTFTSASNAASFWPLPNAVALSDISSNSTAVQRYHFPFLRGI